MTIQEWLTSRREAHARMTLGPWEHYYEDGEPSCEVVKGDARIVFCDDGPHDAAGIAIQKNDAPRLYALVEALVAEREAPADIKESMLRRMKRKQADAALAALLEGK